MTNHQTSKLSLLLIWKVYVIYKYFLTSRVVPENITHWINQQLYWKSKFSAHAEKWSNTKVTMTMKKAETKKNDKDDRFDRQCHYQNPNWGKSGSKLAKLITEWRAGCYLKVLRPDERTWNSFARHVDASQISRTPQRTSEWHLMIQLVNQNFGC